MDFWEVVEAFDNYLDANVGPSYKEQPLAQHWARIAKVGEEAGEALAELTHWTGQNPRKGTNPESYQRMLDELADTALTAIYAVQHFTKDRILTSQIITDKANYHLNRVS